MRITTYHNPSIIHLCVNKLFTVNHMSYDKKSFFYEHLCLAAGVKRVAEGRQLVREQVWMSDCCSS